MIAYRKQISTEEAWDEFFSRFDAFIHSRIAGALRKYQSSYTQADVSDLVQQIYERLIVNDFRALRNFRGQTEQACRAYLARICSNLVADGCRTRNRVSFVDFESLVGTDKGLYTRGQPIAEPNQERAVQQRELRRLIVAILRRMGDGEQAVRDRWVFILRHYQGYSAEEVAQRLQITARCVDTIYCRVKKRLIIELSKALSKGAKELRS